MGETQNILLLENVHLYSTHLPKKTNQSYFLKSIGPYETVTFVGYSGEKQQFHMVQPNITSSVFLQAHSQATIIW